MDRPDNDARFLLLGSASPQLVKGVSESLAGRVGLVDLGGFGLSETGTDAWRKLWNRGGFPRSFLGIPGEDQLPGHPKVGASFEGFVVEQLLGALGTRDAYYWATHAGAELDLLVLGGGRRYGFECKFADAPGTTRSMRVAVKDLGLDHLWIVYPGDEGYVLDDRISALPVAEIGTLVERIGSKGW